MSTGIFKDAPVKNVLADYSAEQLEVACYRALVTAAHEAPHHVGAHAPETDHAELHHSLLCAAATAAMTAAPALVESFTYTVSIRPARSPPSSSTIVSRTSASKPG